jgi:hypothetical protein
MSQPRKISKLELIENQMNFPSEQRTSTGIHTWHLRK